MRWANLPKRPRPAPRPDPRLVVDAGKSPPTAPDLPAEPKNNLEAMLRG
jgi:hypothetical protein